MRNEAFALCLRAVSTPASLDAIGPQIGRAIADARALYPGIGLPDADFVDHVVRKLTPADSSAPRPALGDLRIAELFLAWAAGHRDEVAIAAFERDTFGEVEAAYRRFQDLGVTLDDVKQRLREKLLLAEPPSILGYAGTGALRGWVRAAALHMLLNIAKRETREEPTNDAELFEVVIGAEPSAEAAYVKLTCRVELEAALTAAMAALPARDKSLLRHAFVDRRNVDDIGAIYGVHRATAARWVASARDQLVERTREDLIHRLGVSNEEARSIIVAALSGVGSMLVAKLT